MTDILLISLSVSAVIVIMLILTPALKKRYSAKWRYIVWLLLAVRLIIPFRFELPVIPVPVPDVVDIVTLPQDYEVSEPEQRETEPASAQEMHVTSGGRYLPETDSRTSTALSQITKRINVKILASVIWAVGAAAFFLWHVCSYIVLRRKIRPYCKRVNRRVYRCERLESPIMTGFFRPQILIPDINYADRELEMIIKHEMTHYKRRDMWYKLVLLIANAMHWFNPLVYVMVRCADRDLEYSCDDAVVKGEDAEFRKMYSKVILKTIGGNGDERLH